MINSAQVLELPKVLEQLSGYATCERAKERSREITPCTDAESAKVLQALTSSARRLIGLYGAPAFGDIKPVEQSLARAELGGSLNTRELLSIAAVCRVTRQVKSYGARDTDDALRTYFAMLQPNNFLEEKISGSISDEDTIADSASGELASIRRHMRAASSKVRDILQKIISSPSYSKILQDSIITQRGDRFVVPVKAEYKSELPGLTHDVSGSGSTLFVEPMQVVNANNELKELAAKEKTEIERILAELSADCADHADGIRVSFQALVELDVVFARGKYSYAVNGSEPVLNGGGNIHFRNARHPLLSKQSAVPITVCLGGEFDTLVITGPNTGGKTVALKTIGLLSLMAACGLHIPADPDSSAAIFGQVMADIGDEQSIEQSLSTFSSHMVNIVSMLETADNETLMLFDELGAGTDPVEGAALAISIIDRARLLGAKVAATTHYAELKVFALNTAGVENASCEFDVETLRPTYRLLIGVPGKSNAFAISRRLGLDDAIIQSAGERIGQESKAFEDVLSKLEQQRQHWERESLIAAQNRADAERDARKAKEARDVFERERQKAAERAKVEAAALIRETRDTVEAVLAELGGMRKKSADELNYQALNDARSHLRAALNTAESKLAPRQQPEAEAPKLSRPLKIGDTVTLPRSDTRATVLQLPDKAGRVQLQAGLLRITAKQSEVRLAEDEKPIRPKTEASSHVVTGGRAALEVDIRGMMSDEGVSVMEQFLDGAIMSRLQNVTVIHGKGTGALRAAVHSALKRNKQVKAFRLGRYGEGEDGVTIVELK
ncbi:endonuclease MutS2 [Clostridia bacterium]|nr:endonuclease MutS2 [Clostridia bacterium]